MSGLCVEGHPGIPGQPVASITLRSDGPAITAYISQKQFDQYIRMYLLHLFPYRAQCTYEAGNIRLT